MHKVTALDPINNEISIEYLSGPEVAWEDADNFIIMKSLGLQDKYPNGREIYEGDIVRRWDPEDQEYWDVVVSYDADQGGFVPFCDADFGFDDYRWGPYLVEVIGNIYENPELLK